MFDSSRNLLCSLLLLLGPVVSGTAQEKKPPSPFFPPIKAASTGMLKVSDLHEIYWETSGNSRGIPVFVLHGGPGVGSSPSMRSFFDPGRYHIIQFDQRGCGKSRPYFEWRENTTMDLVEDINRLRNHLGIKGKAVLWGLSWGTTLALAYSQAFPENVSGLVLLGVFTGRKCEIDHLYHGGAGKFYPENFRRLQSVVPDPGRLDYPRQLFEVITGEDEAAQERAIEIFAMYEVRMVSVTMTDERARAAVLRQNMAAFALLENHYMMHGCFLEEGQLLRDAGRIAHIPACIVAGRLDMVTPPASAYILASKLKKVKFQIVPGAGHNDKAVFEAAVKGAAWVADRVEGK